MRGNETKLGWLRALTITCSNQFPLRPPRTAAGWATNQVFFWSLHWPEAIPHASGLGVKFQIRFAVCFQHIPAATHLAQFHLNCNGALQHPEVFNLLLREDRERSLLLALLAVDTDRTALRWSSERLCHQLHAQEDMQATAASLDRLVPLKLGPLSLRKLTHRLPFFSNFKPGGKKHCTKGFAALL
mgnify:CR=1 FL=1